MNRLKFRVWDLQNEKFYYPSKGYQGHYVLSLDGKFTNLQNGAGGSECIVHQFTGILDKNGKEIYEGDIIKGIFYIGMGGEMTNTATVQWTNEEGYQWNYWDLTTIEIVGNIFENHELKSFDKSMQDIEEGKVVTLEQALTEKPPVSKELQKIINDIEHIEAEKEAWKKMFHMQSKLVTNLELDKLKLKNENETLQSYLNDINR